MQDKIASIQLLKYIMKNISDNPTAKEFERKLIKKQVKFIEAKAKERKQDTSSIATIKISVINILLDAMQQATEMSLLVELYKNKKEKVIDCIIILTQMLIEEYERYGNE